MPSLLFQAAAMMSHLQTKPQSILAMRPYNFQAEHLLERLQNCLETAHFGTIVKKYKNGSLAVAFDNWFCVQLRPYSSRALHLEHSRA